jgi:hypothetical protein
MEGMSVYQTLWSLPVLEYQHSLLSTRPLVARLETSYFTCLAREVENQDLVQIGDNESRRGRFSLSSRNEAVHWEQAGPGLANGDSIEQGEDKND